MTDACSSLCVCGRKGYAEQMLAQTAWSHNHVLPFVTTRHTGLLLSVTQRCNHQKPPRRRSCKPLAAYQVAGSPYKSVALCSAKLYSSLSP